MMHDNDHMPCFIAGACRPLACMLTITTSKALALSGKATHLEAEAGQVV